MPLVEGRFARLEAIEWWDQARGSRSKVLFSGVDPAESERWEISIARARRDLSYRPRLTLADSLDALVRELSGARAPRVAR